MEQSDEPTGQNRFAEFFAPFGGFFKRQETRQSAQQYIRGLLMQTKRKNCWQIADALGEANPGGIQRLLCGADWDENSICQQLRTKIASQLGDPAGIAVIAEYGFTKRGNHSAGVARQSWGAYGKMENCQVGVYLTYLTSRGQAFLDRELYLPTEWCDDALRRTQAKIPESVTYHTKAELALQMLERTYNERLPLQWVVGGGNYGNDPALRSTVARAGWYYILAISKAARVQLRNKSFQTVKAITANLPAYAWKRSRTIGKQTATQHEWFAQRVLAAGDQLGEQWLLACRSVDDPQDITFFLSNAPAETSFNALVEVANTQSVAEGFIEEANCTIGLGEYEVRQWRSWYRHMTLAFVAHCWAAFSQPREPKANPGTPNTANTPKFNLGDLYHG